MALIGIRVYEVSSLCRPTLPRPGQTTQLLDEKAKGLAWTRSLNFRRRPRRKKTGGTKRWSPCIRFDNRGGMKRQNERSEDNVAEKRESGMTLPASRLYVKSRNEPRRSGRGWDLQHWLRSTNPATEDVESVLSTTVTSVLPDMTAAE